MNYYIFDKINDVKYIFSTRHNVCYEIEFQDSYDFFKNDCNVCDEIFMMNLWCTSQDSPKFDSRIAITISKIVENFLSHNCRGIIYTVDNSDGKGHQRKLYFERMEEKYGFEEIEISGQEFLGDNASIEYSLIRNRDCDNANEIYEEFYYNCKPCCSNTSI